MTNTTPATVNELLQLWDNFKQPITTISWNDVFILQAYLASIKSRDSQTQCGCVLVKYKTSIMSGYNSFIRDINDSVLPNVRPEKYDFMIHAEHNAILNCAREGVSTVGATAYITGPPCISCFQIMHQAGINEIIYYDSNIAKMIDNLEYQLKFEILSQLSKMHVTKLPSNPDLDAKIKQIQSLRNLKN